MRNEYGVKSNRPKDRLDAIWLLCFRSVCHYSSAHVCLVHFKLIGKIEVFFPLCWLLLFLCSRQMQSKEFYPQPHTHTQTHLIQLRNPNTQYAILKCLPMYACINTQPSHITFLCNLFSNLNSTIFSVLRFHYVIFFL